jgi:hypothetical protein
MRSSSRIALVAMAATLVLASAAATVSAGRINVSETGFLFSWPTTAPLTFRSEAETFRAVCAFRIKGNFHSTTIAKTPNSLVGTITESRNSSCTAEDRRAWILNGVEKRTPEETPFPSSLNWHLTYQSFSGTLPSIVSVRFGITRFSVLIEELFESCLYQSTVARPFLFDAVLIGSQIRGATAVAAQKISVTEGAGFCPDLQLSGTGTSITNTNKSRLLFLRLI